MRSAVGKSLLTLATTTVGLTAGVFFDWQVTVMPGLGELPDAEFIAVFQALDRAIINPIFIGGAFMGGAASLVAATVAHRHEPARFRLLAAASGVYVLGVVGVTMAGNVPLNEKLAEISVASASGAEMAAATERLRGAMESTPPRPHRRRGRLAGARRPRHADPLEASPVTRTPSSPAQRSPSSAWPPDCRRRSSSTLVPACSERVSPGSRTSRRPLCASAIPL